MGQTNVSSYTNVVDIAATTESSILLLATGQVIIVGQSSAAQIDVPADYFQQIGAGVFHLLAITTNAEVRAWGLNADGQLNVPTNITNAFQVVGGMSFSAALVESLTTPIPTSTMSIPTAPALPLLPTKVVQPSHAQYVVINNGVATSLQSFGGSEISLSQFGMVTINGNGEASPTDSCALPRNTNIYHIQLGNTSPDLNVSLHTDHTIQVWACQSDLSTVNLTTTIPPAFQHHVAEVAVQGNHIVILTVDGRLWSNTLALPQLPNIKHIVAGRNFAAILFTNGTVRIWATDNDNGILNIPTNANNITDIAAGDFHIIARRNDGTLVSWGGDKDDYGQSDVPFAARNNVLAITANQYQSMALLTNGQAVAWGKYAPSTNDALQAINENYRISGIVTADDRIGLIIDGSAQDNPTNTSVPTPTTIVVPTMTPRANQDEFTSGQMAWYTMSDSNPNHSHAGEAVRYRTGLTATQSTTDLFGPELALDNTTTNLSRTTAEQNAWWQVDLGSVKDVSSVVVYNRNDCCLTNLNDSLLMLSTTNLGSASSISTLKSNALLWKNLTCANNDTTCTAPSKSSYTIQFPVGTRARFIRIQSQNAAALAIAEVQIFGAPSTFECSNPRTCPSNVYDINNPKFPALSFDDTQSNELIASSATSLNGVPFTVRASMKRTALNRHDVMLSIGAPAVIRQYLVLGIDKENRPYCSFYGDDLRSTTWYVDREWHNYACSYDPVLRTRTLWRDNTIIGQDTIKADFTPPAAPLIIGRRYDSMAGANALIRNVDIIDHVITRSEITNPASVNRADKLSALAITTDFQNSAPNASTLQCGIGADVCPAIISSDQSGYSFHDETFAELANGSQLRLSTAPLTTGYTIAYWANFPIAAEASNDYILATNANVYSSSGKGGIYMGFTANTNNSAETPICIGISDDGTNTKYIAAPAVAFNTWNHYACSVNTQTNTLSFYVNSVLVSSESITLPPFSAPLLIGVFSSSPMTIPLVNAYIDDVMIYTHPVLASTLVQIYNNTNPAVQLPTPTLDSGATNTPRSSSTAKPSSTATVTVASSKTAIPATRTATMPGITPYTVTLTRTSTRTLTRTITPSMTFTITQTPTLPSATPYTSSTPTFINTRTPLYTTKTMLARRSATLFVETVVANNKTSTAQVLTATARAIATRTNTATAYPPPQSPTRTATAYPTP